MKRKVAIIGGGASGMTAAITAARAGASVTVYERNDRPGKKILVTGNGKCNLGNEKLSAEDYHCGDKAKLAFWLERFGTEETKNFFDSLGLLIRAKNGCLYPACEQAAVVLDVLRFGMEQNAVTLVPQTKITRIVRKGTGRLEAVWEGGSEDFDSIVLACGGVAAPKTGSDGSGYRIAKQLGLSLVDTVPALTALRCREEYCKALAGVRAEAKIWILEGRKKLFSEYGELQMVDYGISGIPVFQMSGQVNRLLKQGKNLHAEIDFLPDWSDEAYEDFVRDRLKLRPKQEKCMTVEKFFTGILHKKVMTLLIGLSGLKTNETAADADVSKLKEVFRLCRALSFHITGSNSYDQAQVCSGGVALQEVTKRLEAVKVPGLYLAGEMLDVDGRCGGYNLQWAWSSGYIAGLAAARQTK